MNARKMVGFIQEHLKSVSVFFVPSTANRNGKVVLIGYNLRLHFSPSVIQECVNRDIYFICLPPNGLVNVSHLMWLFSNQLKSNGRIF